MFSKPDDILTAAEKYIQENGPEAFERLIARVIRINNLFTLNFIIFYITIIYCLLMEICNLYFFLCFFFYCFLVVIRLIENQEPGGAATQSFMMTMSIEVV